jgi:hypothetical protein
VILKVYLDDFVWKTEHDSMSRSHPLFHIDHIFNLTLRLLNLFRNRFVTWLWFCRAF